MERNEIATDKQVEYLEYLRDKARRIQAMAEAHGQTVYKKGLAYRDYKEAQRRGMTRATASEQISAWRRLVLYGNAILSLFNLQQVTE